MDAIVAANTDWGIGLHGSQSIVIPEDRHRFRKLTSGSTIIAGRRTFADFPSGAPLPDRLNLVFSRNKTKLPAGAAVVRSLYGLSLLLNDIQPERIFVVGGASIYALLLPYCSNAFVTKIHTATLSDAFFPNLDETPSWILRERGQENSYNNLTYTFDIYENNKPLDIMELKNV